MSALSETAESPSPGPGTGLVVVTVGTDHHPFDRLITWVNDYLANHPDQAGRFFVQAGSATVDAQCPGARFLEADRLDQVLGRADVLICHGGPGSIADAWERGYRPIVVPRLREFGEAVDDHQVDFCARLASVGRIWLARDSARVSSLLETAVEDGSGFRGVTGVQEDPGTAAAVHKFGELVEALVGDGRQRDRKTRWPRPRQRLMRGAVTDEECAHPDHQDMAQSVLPHQKPLRARAAFGGVPEKERK